jgi:hypothetical protein
MNVANRDALARATPQAGNGSIGDDYGGSESLAADDTAGNEPEDTAHKTLNAHESKTEPAVDSDWPDQIDDAAYHGIAGDIVHAIEPHTEADPVALLVQLLVGFGSIIGTGSHYEVEGAQHPARLFAVLVGQSSKSRKGTSWRHLRRLLQIADEEWATNRIVEGLSSGEGLIWAVRDSVEREEAVKKGGKNTGTYENVRVDPGIQDKRLLVMEGEFASVLRILGRDGNTLSAIMRRAWDDGDLHTLVKHNPNKATGAHISIVGHITRDELLRYLDSTEQGNGFANRFLWLAVRRSKVLPEGGGTVVLGDIPRRLREAISFAGQENRVLTFDDSARHMWSAVYPDLSEGKPGLLGAVTGRAEAYVMRLAVAYALLDCCPHMCPKHLEAALAVWDYCERSAAWIFGTANGDPIADRIMSALQSATDNTMTRTELRKVFSGHKRSEQVTTAIARLETAGRVAVESVATGGRNAERITLLMRGKRPMRDKGQDTALSAGEDGV